MSAQETFAQSRGKRDYRAVLFSCAGLETIEQVTELFDGEVLNARRQRGLAPLDGPDIAGTRVTYRSETCFLRTGNEERRAALRTGNEQRYEYEVCVLVYQKGKAPTFLVAVPFASMARELFGKIHSARPNAAFRYFRPALEAVVSALLDPKGKLERLRTVGINWAVAGDTGRSDQITVRGTDVVHSAAFKHLHSPDSKLTLALRKVQVIHEGFGGQQRIKLTFDKFGNYGIWVTQDGQNLPDVFRVFESLRKLDLIQAEIAFPVRNREDEPLMP